MAFSIDDMLERMGFAGVKQGRECYREEAASLGKASAEEIKTIFPNVVLSESKELIYAPFRLCHSLPKINLRGRSFTPKVLSNSFASVRDAAINIDHQMKYRNQGGGDTICGHVVCGRFDPQNLFVNDEVASVKIPTEPIPIVALAAFHLRSQYLPKVLEEHLSNKRKWLTSMECAHNWDEAAFFYRGNLIPIADAENGMRECVEKYSIKPFKGHELSLCLGGANGKVDFHAAALTPDPADDDARIMAFVTQDQYLEAANSGERKSNPFFFPLETRFFDEDHKKPSNEKITEDELANIAVIGQTDASEDGHTHDILSDGTIMPSGGHTHYLNNWNLTRGTTPRFSGRTSDSYQDVLDGAGNRKSYVHLHLINIPLKGKNGTKTGTVAGDATASSGDQTVLPIENPLVPVSSEFPMDKLLERMLAVLASGKFEGTAQTEVASLTAELRKTGQDNYLKQLVQTEVANQIAAGDLLKKEDHDKQVAEAVKLEQEKAEKEKKETEKRTSRREKVIALGLSPEDKFDDKLDTTIGQYIDAFGLDDNGEKLFNVALATFQKLAEPPADPKTEQTGVETQAANKGGTEKKGEKKDEQASKPRMLLAGRAGNGEGEEHANNNPTKTGDKKVGRHLFSGK